MLKFILEDRPLQQLTLFIQLINYEKKELSKISTFRNIFCETGYNVLNILGIHFLKCIFIVD